MPGSAAESGVAKWLGAVGARYTELCLGLVVAIALCVLVPVSPAFQQVPLRDSGAFLYIGRRVLAGEVLYREIWDHKPPLIHYINALGLLVGSGSRWGVWALEWLSLSAAGVLSFALLARSFSLRVAILGTAVWLFNLPSVVDGGNLTEEYVLVFQFLALYALSGAEAGGRRWWRMCLIGCTGSVAFLLKQTVVATWVSIALYLAAVGLLSSSWRNVLSDFASMFLGACLVLIAVLMPSFHAGGIGDLWDAAFRYNIAYGRTATLAPFEGLVAGVRHMSSRSGLLVVSLAGWFGGLTCLLWGYRPSGTSSERGAAKLSGRGCMRLPRSPLVRCSSTRARQSSARDGTVVDESVRMPSLDRAVQSHVPSQLSAGWRAVGGSRALLSVSVLALPFEMGLTCLSGRFFPHYCISWLPTLGILAAFLAHLPYALGGPGPMSFYRSRQPATIVWVIGILALGSCGFFAHLQRPAKSAWATQRAQVSRFIQDSSSAADSVLVWGAEAGVLYQSDRVAPTRFVYQYPLYVPGYYKAELVNEILGSVKTTCPLLIIDSLNCATPLGEAQVRNCPSALRYERPAELDMVFEYVGSHYRRVDSIGPEAWPVYVRDGS